MNVVLAPGKYVLAVSGGVDSMVLLHVLQSRPDLELVVAHFNHGIRADAAKDAELVERTALALGLPFELGHGHLGADASEARAREARYAFLRRVCKEYRAQAIVTAHHQDDMLETALINLLRGTGRRGLTALRSQADIKRPLLDLTKSSLYDYAQAHAITWNEDTTNADQSYLRNYVRHALLGQASMEQKQQLLATVQAMQQLNLQIDETLATFVPGRTLSRRWFNALPYDVSCEVMMHFLRSNDIRGYSQKMVGRLVVAVKTARPGSQHDVMRHTRLRISNDAAELVAAA